MVRPSFRGILNMLSSMEKMVLMHQTMRWFGPHDPVPLQHIRQAGAAGIVTALHHIPPGEVWTKQQIQKRKREIEQAGLQWTVVESLPVHDDIKRRSGNFHSHIDHYRESLVHLAECGLRTVVYNFMPVLDWVRTDIDFEMPDQSLALRFNRIAFIAFDLFLLKRPGAEKEYNSREVKSASEYIAKLTPEASELLFRNVLLGLPGSDTAFTAIQVLEALETYRGIDAKTLRRNLAKFLEDIIPIAESLDIRMAIHPDDPPFPILGLPRIVSTEEDLAELFTAIPSLSNGICFCTGSLGVRQDNDLRGMIRRLGNRIHFLHLRNTRRDSEGNFFEADHLDGDAPMPAIVRDILDLMQRTGRSIPMRPDHGHRMLDDMHKSNYPGYSAIGRLRALAELRGLENGLATVYSGEFASR